MKAIVNLSFIFVSLFLFTTSSVAQNWGGGVAPVDYSRYGKPQVPVKVLVLIPEEFERFVHVSTYEGNQTHHPFGEDALRELRIALGVEFASVEFLPVRSEAEAMAMLTRRGRADLETRAYDYVAIPKFMRVDSPSDNQKYMFDIDLLMEFYGKDGATVTTIRGHGKSSTGKWFASTPEKGARIALQSAVSAVLDGVEKGRNLFVH